MKIRKKEKQTKEKSKVNKKNDAKECIAIFLCTFFSIFVFLEITFFFVGGEKIVFYALCEGEYQSEKEASVGVSAITLVGGAGSVWQEDDSYFVVAFLYDTKEDAKSVLERLWEEDVSLELEKLEFDVSELTEEERTYVDSLLSIAERIYSISCDLAGGGTAVQTRIMLEEIQKSLLLANARAQSMLEKGESKVLASVLGEILESKFTIALAGESYAQKLIYLRCEVILTAKNFCENC